MLKQSNLFLELSEGQPDIWNPHQIDQFRLFCYGFRAGGFVDVTASAIQELAEGISDSGVKKHLSAATVSLNAMKILRGEAVPSGRLSVQRFNNYCGLVKNILANLGEAAAREKEVAEIHSTFLEAVERVTSSNGLYVLNWNDEFLANQGAIDLVDQGLKIVQVIFSNVLGLHFSIIAPGTAFYHEHRVLSEFHFVERKCPYIHYVNGKGFQVQEADVVFTGPRIPHGGTNSSGGEHIKVGFAAGSLFHGPWRADFNDRTNHSMDALRESNEIAELNGVHLDKAIRESMDKTSRRSSVFPAPETDDIGLDVLHVNEAMSVRSDRDQIFKVVQGEGRIMIGENIQVRLQPQDSFPLPGGIEASVVSNGMVLFGFY